MNNSDAWIHRDERGCPVAPRISAEECFSRLTSALARLRSTGAVMCPPMTVREWRGEPSHGCFVRIDARTYALHVGRGSYLTLDVERDLNGVPPREAMPLMLQPSGNVRKPDVSRSHSAV